MAKIFPFSDSVHAAVQSTRQGPASKMVCSSDRHLKEEVGKVKSFISKLTLWERGFFLIMYSGDLNSELLNSELFGDRTNAHNLNTCYSSVKYKSNTLNCSTKII